MIFRNGRGACILLGIMAALTSCGHIYGPNTSPSGSPGPTPTGSASPTPSPVACNTPDVTNPNVIFVAMASGISAVKDSVYGTINGYGAVDANGIPPLQAAVVKQWTDSTGATHPVTPQDTLQFFNAESAGSPVLHSAYGFSGNAFPSAPFSFPSPAPSPTGSILSRNAWFTGRIGSPIDTTCFSREFSLKMGSFYFGDYDYYNLSTLRDVVVVSTPSPARAHGRHFAHRPLPYPAK
jgi:hypothetical protein